MSGTTIPPRYIRGADISDALSDGTKVPASSIPFGTTSGTVADGSAVAAVSDAAASAASIAQVATTTAASAVTTANSAVFTAGDAASKAAVAAADAATAKANAASALTAAGAAGADAAAALTAAQTAQTAATSAATSATNAQALANTANLSATNSSSVAAGAVTTANAAASSVAGAVAAANGAATSASAAAADATNALSAANAANTTATAAGTASSAAVTTANAAQATATAAKTAADIATAKVNTIASITIDGLGFHALMPDGSIQNFIPSTVTPPPTTVTTYPLASAGTPGASLFPNTFISLDAALPATQASLSGSVAGIQVDGDGYVLSLVEPITKARANAGYGRTQLVNGGAGGFPFFHSTPQSYNNAYDALQLDPALGTAMFGPVGGTWTVLFVMRQTGVSASGFMAVRTASNSPNITILGGGTDGRIRLEQNNGSAVGTESPSGATALNQWQVVIVTCDGTRMSLYRNGVRTFQTPTGTIGGLNVAPQLFEFLNNAQADVSLIEAATGVPSISQLNARTAALGTRYNITVSTVTQGSSSAIPGVPVDLTATYSLVPSFPVSDVLPTITGATPGNSLTLTGGSTQVFSCVFGSAQTNANIVTEQDVYNRFYTRFLVDNQTDTQNIVQQTGHAANDQQFYARMQHYKPGDPNTTLLMRPEGLHIRAIAGKNRTDVTMGGIRAGMIRLPTVFKPGMTVKIRYCGPRGPHSWLSLWAYSGEQRTPGPGGNPYTGNGTNNSYIRTAGGGQGIEIDLNDNYPRPEGPTPVGQQLDFGIPDIYGMAWPTHAPSDVYIAPNGNGYLYHPSPPNYPDYLSNSNADFGTGFHNLVMSWEAGTKNVHMFQDGKNVWTKYLDYGAAATYQDANNATQTLGMSLFISNQACAIFTPGVTSATDNDGMYEQGTPAKDGWTGVIQEISAWTGNIANVAATRPT